MSTKQVSPKYARALCAAAKDKGLLDTVEKELKVLAGILVDNAEFAGVFFNPGVSVKAKIKVFEAVFSKDCSDIFVSFLKVVAEKRREDCIDDIIRLYKTYANEERNLLIGQLVTADKLADVNVAVIADRIKQLTGKTAIIEQVVDASVIGGFALQINDICYDGTIKRRLENIKALLNGK
ncbi:MAG: ATP synthase F1 subunit delta [Negativicutes bacterium]|jgi:F-type H+-transporting ATPase subunit delta